MIIMDYGEWHPGDPIGFGNDIGAPEVPYMSYGPRKREDEIDEEALQKEREEQERKQTAEKIADEAWKLYKERSYGAALVFIDRALEYAPEESNMWNRKGAIFTELKIFETALENYNKAIELEDSEVYKNNKAETLIDWAYSLKDKREYEKARDKINESIDIFQNISYKTCESEAYNLKGLILEEMGEILPAFMAYKKAVEHVRDDDMYKGSYKRNRDHLLQYIEDEEFKCPECGNKLRITDNFCNICGAKFDEPLHKKDKSKTHYSEGVTVIEFDDED